MVRAIQKQTIQNPNYKTFFIWLSSEFQPPLYKMKTIFGQVSNGWASGFQMPFTIQNICKPTSSWTFKVRKRADFRSPKLNLTKFIFAGPCPVAFPVVLTCPAEPFRPCQRPWSTDTTRAAVAWTPWTPQHPSSCKIEKGAMPQEFCVCGFRRKSPILIYFETLKCQNQEKWNCRGVFLETNPIQV